MSTVYGRRRFLQQVGGLALGAGGLSLAGCGSGGGSSASKGSSKTLVYAGFGGAYQEKLEQAILKPFEKETGIKVTAATGAESPAQLKAMVTAGNTTWDIMDLYAATAGTNQALGLLQAIDYDKVKLPQVSDQKAIAGKYGIGYYLYSHNIWRNKSVIKQPLTSWVDVLDVAQFPGKRGFLNTPAYSPEEVMLGTGRSIDSVYPIDIDLYLSTLSKIRKAAVFLDTNPLTNQVTQGDIATGDLNQTRLNSAIDAGAPIEYNWMQTIVDVNRWGIPKGAPNLENAYKLINFSLRPDIQKSIPKAFGTYSPVVTGAYKGMTLDEQKNLAGSPPNRDQSVFLQTDWYAQHGNELSQKFAQWLTS